MTNATAAHRGPLLIKYLTPAQVRTHLEFGVLRAPSVEYGVNAGTEEPFAGSAGVRRDDFLPTNRQTRRYRHGASNAIPAGSPGSIGRPSLASAAEGDRLYHLIYDRVASRVFRRDRT